MKFDWKVEQCIVCRKESPLCEEHLIPRALGGSLSCNFLCNACNSWFGHEVDVSAISDPSILLAAHALRQEIPELAQQIIGGSPHVTTGGGPRVSGYIRNQEFRVKSQTLDDGSLILPLDETAIAVATMLKRGGHEEKVIQRALKAVEKLPESRRTTIAPGLEIINWRVQKIHIDFNESTLLDPLLPAKTAFEFLALFAGKAIYADEWPLSDLRRILMKQKDLDDVILRVERLSSGKYEPLHGICIEDNLEYSQIQIRLFGWLAYRGHFPRLRIDIPRYAYIHRLNTDEENLGVIGADPTSSAK